MDNNRNVELLEKEPIGKLLVKFSLPAIIGMLVMASYNVVDRLFVGNGVGTMAISGITITFPLIIIVLGFGMLVGIGSTALVSIKLGEKKNEEAEQIIGTALVMSFIVSALIMIIGYSFMEPMLIAFGGSGEVLVYAKSYLTIILIGIPFQQVSFAMNAIIRGQGDPKQAMLTMLIGAGLNIALNPLFIFVFHWGIQGSAIATVISQFVSCSWVLYYFVAKKSYVKLHLHNIRLNYSVLPGILAIGMSPFIMQIAGSVINIIINNELAEYGGDIAIAAMGIGYSLIMMIFMPIFGINQGIQPIVGYNYGAKNFDRVRETLKLGIISASSFCIFGFIVIMIFAESIMGLFSGGDQQLIDIGAHGIRIFTLTLPIIGFQIISISYFQAVGKPKQSLILTLTRNGGLVIPLLFILPRIFLLDGIWMTTPISDFLSSILAAIFLLSEMKRLKNRHIESSASLSHAYYSE
jgi:putative MATE family efflux protein